LSKSNVVRLAPPLSKCRFELSSAKGIKAPKEISYFLSLARGCFLGSYKLLIPSNKHLFLKVVLLLEIC